MDMEPIIEDITKNANPPIDHNETVSQIEQVFRKHGFYTTREYQIYKKRMAQAGLEGLIWWLGKGNLGCSRIRSLWPDKVEELSEDSSDKAECGHSYYKKWQLGA